MSSIPTCRATATRRPEYGTLVTPQPNRLAGPLAGRVFTMPTYLTTILTSQFEAALSMLHHCLAACPEDHWDSKIANGTVRQTAYHTLFFVDLYLSPSEHAFTLRDLHARGGDERSPHPSPGLDKPETLAYLANCLEKTRTTLAAETEQSLAADSGFSYRQMTRGELHLYNLRHIQHHTGSLSAHLRRTLPHLTNQQLPWVGKGWKSPPPTNN